MLGKDYRRAMDLHEVSSGDSSLPTSFRKHLLQLMSSVAAQRRLNEEDDVGGERQLVRDLIPFVAACITAQQLPTDGPSKESTSESWLPVSIAYRV